MAATDEVNVRDFGACGDGAADDTAALQQAIDSTTGAIFFPAGQYRLTQGLKVDLAKRGRTYVRSGGAQLINESDQPALHITGSHFGTAQPEDMSAEVAAGQLQPTVSDIEIVGADGQGDGIRLEGTHMAIVSRVTIRDCRHGIHLPHHNRNVIIADCHVYHCSGVGVFLDEVNLHQINIHGSHISYNARGGIKVLRGNVRNLQIVGNDIEYNFDREKRAAGDHGPVADVWIIAGPIGIREGAIVGNTIQALRTPGGANVRIEGTSPEEHERALKEESFLPGRGEMAGQQAGLFSIVGNHITNQDYNILIRDASGIAVGNNQHIAGFARNILLERCQQITLTGGIIDYIHDYARLGEPLCGGIELRECTACTLSGCILHGCGPAAALTLRDCRGINVSGCTFRSPRGKAITIDDVTDSRVSGCIFLDEAGTMTEQISMQRCEGVVAED